MGFFLIAEIKVDGYQAAFKQIVIPTVLNVISCYKRPPLEKENNVGFGLKYNGSGHCEDILKSFTIRSNYSLNDFYPYQRQVLDKYDFGYHSHSYQVCTMNYLAHAYLSFGNAGILAGNMVSDFVKGRKKFDYPAIIQQGFTLHRAIDEFTDGHEQTKIAKTFFRPAYRLYSGAFIDIVYDHFLANDKRIFTPASLREFATDTYEKLEPQLRLLPERFQRMFPYMESQNWLYHYRYEKGIENSFGGLVRRAQYMDSSEEAFRIFKDHYQPLSDCYDVFFPELEEYSREIYNGLTK